jgi:hypothetical protein
MDTGIKMSKKDRAQGLTLSWETADQITLASLINHRDYLKSELKQWKKNPKTDSNPDGYWMHPEDVSKNQILIHHMDAIIDYYGG